MTTVDDILEHHGIKGMKWGVTKNTPSATGSNRPRLSDHQKIILKRAAIGIGVAAVILGAAYAGKTINSNHALKMADLATKSKTAAKGAEAAAKILQEPTGLIHASRGKNVGFQFVQKGGLKDPLSLYDKMFPSSDGAGVPIDHFAKIDGKIAASFLDPHGRRDHAGRVIPHEVIIPKHMTDGINNIDDVKKKIWPLISNGANEIFNRQKTGFNGQPIV